MGYKQAKFIWLDGEYIAWEDAQVHCLTHTLHYGVGVFEGLRAYETDQGPAIYRLRDHTDRLFRSAHIIGMQIPYNKDVLNTVQQEIIKKNDLTSAYIRPMAYYGSEYLGLQTSALSVHVMIAAWQWDSYLPPEKLATGIKVRTSSFTRSHINSVLCKAKANGNYLNSVLALQEAVASGCDEALLLDHQGCVAEGSGQNIFIVQNNKLITPETTSALPGITRDTIITLAQDLGYSVQERQMTRDEIYIADEAFFTGSATEVMAICELDGRVIGEGKRGPVTKRLADLYTDLVRGKNAKYLAWLN